MKEVHEYNTLARCNANMKIWRERYDKKLYRQKSSMIFGVYDKGCNIKFGDEQLIPQSVLFVWAHTNYRNIFSLSLKMNSGTGF